MQSAIVGALSVVLVAIISLFAPNIQRNKEKAGLGQEVRATGSFQAAEYASIESLSKREAELRPKQRLTLDEAPNSYQALAWLETLLELISRLDSAGQLEPLSLARRFMDYAPIIQGNAEFEKVTGFAWPLEVVSLPEQKRVLSLLRHFNETDRSVALAVGLERLCRHQLQNGSNQVEHCRELVSALFGLGSVLSDTLNYSGAIDVYSESVSITKTLLEKEPKSSIALHDAAVALQNLADASRRSGQAVAADGYDREALALSRASSPTDTSVDYLQRNPLAREMLRDLTASINRVANIERRFGRFDLALQLDTEGLHLSNSLLACELSRDTRRNVAAFVSKLAFDKKGLGLLSEALVDLTANIIRFEQIERSYGGADALWDLQRAHRDAGAVAKLLAEHETACRHFGQRKQLLERMRMDYGNSDNIDQELEECIAIAEGCE